METRKCITCDLYNPGIGRCKNGQINPGTKYDTRRIMQVKGVKLICKYNEHRLEIAESLGRLNDIPDDEKQ